MAQPGRPVIREARQGSRDMLRYGLIFGSISGLIVGGLLWLGVAVLTGEGQAGSQLFGYLSMLLALSFIFVAIKRFRDIERGGVIKFWPALWLGLQVTLVATAFYVVTWEIYLATTDGSWMADYIAAEIAAREAAGASQTEIDRFAAEMQGFVDLYANWWFRMPMTAIEILPVGLIVSLVSAGLLRNPNFLMRRPVV